MSSRFGERLDQFFPDLLCERRQGALREFFQFGWGINAIQQALGRIVTHDSSKGLSSVSPWLFRVMISIRFSAASSFSRQIWSNFIPSS